jgi:mono/diheme cytochrome c family protein
MKRASALLLCVTAGAAFSLGGMLAGCHPALPPGKPVSELSPQEAAGYEVYKQQCARCHNAYDTHALHAPSLYGVFRQPYLPSGAVANDDRVTAVILHGRDMMPAFNNSIDQQQLEELLAYLHTL